MVAAEAATAPRGARPLRRRTTSHPDALDALFLLCPMHCIDSVCILAHAARLCNRKKDARRASFFCAYFFARVRRRVSSSTSPSTSS